jgi:hypothetical protein
VNRAKVDPIRKLVAQLEKSRKELSNIARRLGRNNDVDVAKAELDVWEDRTYQVMVDSGASEVATKLDEAKWRIVQGEFLENLDRRISAKESVLIAFLNDFEDHPDFWRNQLEGTDSTPAAGNAIASVSVAQQGAVAGPLSVVHLICSKLHVVARQLEDRHDGRTTLKIQDEYDVQDLLHSLLRLHFDDVRPEEWTPSYAGGSARMDFLLKTEQIVIEGKMARPGREAKKISDELIIDAARYKSHHDCRVLVCLVHDPDRVIKNPRGIEHDLGKLSDSSLQVVAVVAP